MKPNIFTVCPDHSAINTHFFLSINANTHAINFFYKTVNVFAALVRIARRDQLFFAIKELAKNPNIKPPALSVLRGPSRVGLMPASLSGTGPQILDKHLTTTIDKYYYYYYYDIIIRLCPHLAITDFRKHVVDYLWYRYNLSMSTEDLSQ